MRSVPRPGELALVRRRGLTDPPPIDKPVVCHGCGLPPTTPPAKLREAFAVPNKAPERH
jgi:hypothetical protein